MSQGIKIQKTVKLSKFEIVKYQLIHHCFVADIQLSNTELNCLALLGVLGKIRATEFCKIAADRKILGSIAAVNNCLYKLEMGKMFLKTKGYKKLIYLNPELNVQVEGNIIIELKLFAIETNKSTGIVQKNSEALELAGGVH